MRGVDGVKTAVYEKAVQAYNLSGSLLTLDVRLMNVHKNERPNTS